MTTAFIPKTPQLRSRITEKFVQVMPYNYHGLLIYPSLPHEYKYANESDLLTEKKAVRIGTDFLVKCQNTDEYEHHKAGDDFMEKWFHFIDAGRIFIKK